MGWISDVIDLVEDEVKDYVGGSSTDAGDSGGALSGIIDTVGEYVGGSDTVDAGSGGGFFGEALDYVQETVGEYAGGSGTDAGFGGGWMSSITDTVTEVIGGTGVSTDDAGSGGGWMSGIIGGVTDALGTTGQPGTDAAASGEGWLSSITDTIGGDSWLDESDFPVSICCDGGLDYGTWVDDAPLDWGGDYVTNCWGGADWEPYEIVEEWSPLEDVTLFDSSTSAQIDGGYFQQPDGSWGAYGGLDGDMITSGMTVSAEGEASYEPAEDQPSLDSDETDDIDDLEVTDDAMPLDSAPMPAADGGFDIGDLEMTLPGGVDIADGDTATDREFEQVEAAAPTIPDIAEFDDIGTGTVDSTNLDTGSVVEPAIDVVETPSFDEFAADVAATDVAASAADDAWDDLTG
jgi:hypothetical protein